MKCYYYYYYYYYYFWLTGELYKLGINKFVTTQRSIVKGQKAERLSTTSGGSTKSTKEVL